MKTFFRDILTGCAVLCALTLWVPQTNAAQTASQTPVLQSGKPTPDKPEKNIDRLTMVSVQPEGTDSIGARLGTRLKERFNSSNLFTLNDNEEKDTPRLLLLLSTSPEFSGRPGVGSIYSVCWVYSQGKGYLGYLLARDMGAVNYEEIDALVDKLAERTDAIAAKYGNLWK